MTEKELQQLSYEVASILKMDKELLLLYGKMVVEARAFTREEILELSSGRNKNIIDEMLASGLVILARDKYQPVHPRLGFSNLYRLALQKDMAVKADRNRIDTIIAYFVKRWEEALG
ncbi:MAG: hypothetical protein QXG05_02315 [Nitrososphaerota archaeon]